MKLPVSYQHSCPCIYCKKYFSPSTVVIFFYILFPIKFVFYLIYLVTALFNQLPKVLFVTAEFQSEFVTHSNFIVVVMRCLLLPMSLNFICFMLFLPGK